METMEKALANDFKGFEELQYQLVYHTPKYGNDDDYADEQEVQVFDMYYDVLSGHKSPRGADYRVNMLPTTCHVYFGKVTGATPDGRNAWKVLSEGSLRSRGPIRTDRRQSSVLPPKSIISKPAGRY